MIETEPIMLGGLKPLKITDVSTGESTTLNKKEEVKSEKSEFTTEPTFDALDYFNIKRQSALDNQSLRYIAEINSFIKSNKLAATATEILKSIEARFGVMASQTNRIDNIYTYIKGLEAKGNFTAQDKLNILGDEQLIKGLEENAQKTGDWTPYLRVVDNIKRLNKEVRI